MAVAVSAKIDGVYAPNAGGALNIKVGGQYVIADTVKIKGNGIYAGAGVPPANTALPSITGSTAPGSLLTCTPGTWTGTPAPVLLHQWSLNGTMLSQAFGLTYTIPLTAVPGDEYTCLETAANASGAVGRHSNVITVT
jgi:hypothetical protein